MGCYDTLNFACPACGRTVQVQSKAGPCKLADYNLKDAPLMVIADINDEGQRGKLYCQRCSAQLELEVRFAVSPRIKMDLDGDPENFRKV
jgi:transcription elongation factor Elf1